MLYFFEALTMTQWAVKLGLHGRVATFVVKADTTDDARVILSHTLLRPLQHEGDRELALYEVNVHGGARFGPENISVYLGGGQWATPNLRALAAA